MRAFPAFDCGLFEMVTFASPVLEERETASLTRVPFRDEEDGVPLAGHVAECVLQELTRISTGLAPLHDADPPASSSEWQDPATSTCPTRAQISGAHTEGVA